MSTDSVRQHDRRPAFTFGDHLRKARKIAGMTQVQFADALGDDVTVKNVDSWEADRNRPRDIVDIARRVEDLVGLDRGWMLGFFDTMQVTEQYSESEDSPGATIIPFPMRSAA